MQAIRNTSIASVFGLMFLASLIVQALVGKDVYNQEEIEHAELLDDEPETISLGRYVVSSSYWRAVMENWQSEYLQFTLFALLTVWLLQRGSPESKELDKAGVESEKDQKLGRYADSKSPKWAAVGGLRTFIYSNSLLIVMAAIFLASWFAHSVTGWSDYNAEQLAHDSPDDRVSWWGYVGTSTFWEQTLQNWQSEFLAVGSMAVLAIYLRQRGSPESKPVGEAHDATGVEG